MDGPLEFVVDLDAMVFHHSMILSSFPTFQILLRYVMFEERPSIGQRREMASRDSDEITSPCISSFILINKRALACSLVSRFLLVLAVSGGNGKAGLTPHPNYNLITNPLSISNNLAPIAAVKGASKKGLSSDEIGLYLSALMFMLAVWESGLQAQDANIL